MREDKGFHTDNIHCLSGFTECMRQGHNEGRVSQYFYDEAENESSCHMTKMTKGCPQKGQNSQIPFLGFENSRGME